ncbi:MAG TPA: PKD domain-containing protein [Myxococcales bacterium]|nr:PKD domain-containing protein [Myxococcales bacterium]
MDCNCLIVGQYVLPTPAVPALPANGPTGVSPGGKYSVTAVPGSLQAAAITVIRNADDAVLLNHLEAADWGFSPDDDRLAVAVKSIGGAPAIVTLYDLTTVPATKLHESTPSAAGSAISFSPHGAWYLDVELSTPTSVTLQVLDAQTGLQAFQDSFLFATAPGLPQDQLGAVAVGFGPDTSDRTLTYAYIGLVTPQWTAVNLQTGLRVVDQQPGAAFLWGFSPCGDVIGIVNDHEPAGIKDAEIYATLLAGNHLGASPTFPATDDASLSLDVNNHKVTHNATTEILAPNTATAACPTPPPNTPPTAAFSAPASNLSLVPVVFTDHSTDADGRVVSWSWSFGDGQFSSLRNPTHVFLASGTFTVQLTVTDDGGATDSVTHPVAVTANQPPHAAFTFAPAAPSERDLVTFTDHSTDPDDGVAFLDWNIDGFAFSGSVVQARACPPSMTATLTASDHGGQFDTLTQVIPVTGSGDIHVPAGGDLAAAIAGACPGDRLVLDAGHFTGGVAVSDSLTIKGAGMGATFIDGAGSDPQGWVLRLGSAIISDLTLGGGTGGVLVLANGSLSRVEVAGNGANGGIFVNDQVSVVNVSGSNIHDNQGAGFAMSCCADISVDHSSIARNGGVGLAIAEANSLSFVANDVLDNVGGALAVQVSPGPTDQLRQVLLSRFVGNGRGVFMDTGMLFAGNLVARNAGTGITGGHPDQIVVLDSTIADNTGIGIEAGMSAWNTIVAGNGTDLGGVLNGDHNIIGGAPGFVGAGDYHLAPGSPAIDSGDNARVPAELTTDADGDPRILNAGSGLATVDIGWDEALTGGQGADAGSIDAGPSDAGPSDAGVIVPSDAGPGDAGVIIPSDAGPSDAGVIIPSDAGPSDAGVTIPVGGTDGGTGAAGGSDVASGCGCRNTSSAGDLAWIGAAALLLHHRKRQRRGRARPGR